ncbi:MAG: DegQ family serine endoprotease [Phycisphaerae bacterium]|nr:DegQ family serine endoprotease [Phycisphaerae bacterium]
MERKRALSVVFGLVFILVLNTFCTAEPAGKKDIETLRSTGEVFAEIAEKVTPAVVFVSVEQEVVRQMPDMFFGDPFEEFNDEFFKRFFDQRMPRPRQQRQPRQQKQIRQGQGSGFIIASDGYILTNNHVVENATKITVKLSDDRELEAKVIGTDPQTDVALIKVDANDLPFAELGDSDALKVGQWVIAIGNPFGLSHTVTAGIVSAKGRSKIGITEYEDFIQTDAAINFGNSGGPLLNIDGKVIGINSAIFSRSGGYMGIGFAIPVNMAKYVYQQLKAGGKVTRGYVGIYGEDVKPEMAKLLGAKDAKGIVVNNVVDKSPASRSGIVRGDIIIKKDGKAIEDWNTFRNEIAQIPPGTKINLTVIRDGKEKEIVIELAPRESETASAENGDKELKQIGIAVQDLTKELGQQFGYADVESGVIVSQVEPYSPAAKAGIAAGTLILEVNRQKVENAKNFWELVKKAGDSVLLYIRQNTQNAEISRYVVLDLSK